jgi:hypothetical protein
MERTAATDFQQTDSQNTDSQKAAPGAPNPHGPTPRAAEPKFTVDERNAMRAYLARGEVRLSTMHRVAVGFLSGAGLLLLFPVFLKDGVLTLVRALLDYTPVLPPDLHLLGTLGVVLLYLCLLYPFLLSLSLPGAALLLLLEDIVRFYFVGHPPNFPHEHFNPRFAMTGIAFSPDESEEVKARILRYEYGTDLINFVVSSADAQSGYYSNIIDKPRRLIVPSTRKLPRLLRAGVMQLADPKALETVRDDDVVRIHSSYQNGEGEESILQTPTVERTVGEIDRFNAALGLAGFIERPLYAEVAKTEVSLVRHGLKLRRLVLRYFQALLILIWTALVTFMMLPFLQPGLTSGSIRFSMPMVFAGGFLIWALLAPTIVQLPVQWIVTHARADAHREAVQHFQKLDAVHNFGKLTQRFCYGAVATSVIALVLEILLRV